MSTTAKLVKMKQFLEDTHTEIAETLEQLDETLVQLKEY